MVSEKDHEEVRALLQTLKVGERLERFSQRLGLCLEALMENYCMP